MTGPRIPDGQSPLELPTIDPLHDCGVGGGVA